jgi:ribosomal protein S18 acetylase RimI-like enzyme
MGGLAIRTGRETDLAALLAIEAACFASDRLSRRSLRRLLAVETARIRLASLSGRPVGYHIVLLRAGSAVARLYSLAVDPAARGKGSGAALLDDAEKVSRRLGRKALRLEVRADNAGAIRLYESRGYVRIGTWRQYYADKTDALRYEKRLGPGPRARVTDRQGLDKDRSPADFGVLNSRRKRSRKATAQGYARPAPFAPAVLDRASPAGREA